MKDPNFLIAGGVATGTSFLAYSIKDHPQIYLPKVMRPECGFFYKSWEYKKGKEYYLKKWFNDVKSEVAIGERSALYLHGTFNNVGKRIQKVYPGIKFVFCLRNPTERAYANYRFTALCGYENLPFKEALKQEKIRKNNEKGMMTEIQPHLYKERGCYYEQLEPFFELFPRKNILCIKSENLAKKTKETLSQVFTFLGINSNYFPELQEDFTSPNVKNLHLQVIYKKLLGVHLDVITEEFRKKERTASFLSKVISWNLTTGKSPMGADERKYLNDFYVSHNEKLSKLLGWDLSDWR